MLPVTLLVSLALALSGAVSAADPEFWNPYGFMEPYGGRRLGVIGNSSDAWTGGVRIGRVGWLAGWEGDLSADRGESGAGDRYQVAFDGFLKPMESGRSAVLVLVGLGATRLRGGPAPDDSLFFHYRYGLAYRLRFSERFGVRLDLTALRSRAGDFSSREATLGSVIYF